MNIQIRRRRLLSGALVGAFYSLVILIPNFNYILSVLSSVIVSAIIIFISFGFYSIRSFLKKLATFYAFSFLFTGTMFLLDSLLNTPTSLVNNGVVYINISPLMLILFTVIAYVLIRVFQYLMGRNAPNNEYCKAKIEFHGNSCNIVGKVDTGLNLVEPFSNLPVIVVDPISLKPIIELDEKNLNEVDKFKFRVIPFHALGKDGVLKAFKPDKITIYKSGEGYDRDGYVAICDSGELNGEFNALMNPLIIEQGE